MIHYGRLIYSIETARDLQKQVSSTLASELERCFRECPDDTDKLLLLALADEAIKSGQLYSAIGHLKALEEMNPC